jgi:hypothetical protein
MNEAHNQRDGSEDTLSCMLSNCLKVDVIYFLLLDGNMTNGHLDLQIIFIVGIRHHTLKTKTGAVELDWCLIG